MPMCLSQHVCETVTKGHHPVILPILPFPNRHTRLQFLLQNTVLGEIISIKINMEYRILRPISFQIVNSQSLEQILPSLEIAFEGGNQQALAETAGTAQEINLALLDQTVNQIRLIDIHVTILYQLGKALDSYRVFHLGTLFLADTKKPFFFETSKPLRNCFEPITPDGKNFLEKAKNSFPKIRHVISCQASIARASYSHNTATGCKAHRHVRTSNTKPRRTSGAG